MKIQIDLDPELWNRFRDVVIAKGQTLKEVVPTVFEPALRWYLHDPPLTQGVPIPPQLPPNLLVDHSQMQSLGASPPPEPPSAYQESVKRITAPPLPTVKRCDLCDMPTERTFNHKGRKVCYTCWRDGIINEGTKQEPEVKQ